MLQHCFPVQALLPCNEGKQNHCFVVSAWLQSMWKVHRGARWCPKYCSRTVWLVSGSHFEQTWCCVSVLLLVDVQCSVSSKHPARRESASLFMKLPYAFVLVALNSLNYRHTSKEHVLCVCSRTSLGKYQTNMYRLQCLVLGPLLWGVSGILQLGMWNVFGQCVFVKQGTAYEGHDTTDWTLDATALQTF